MKAASPGATGRVIFVGVGLGERIAEQIGGDTEGKKREKMLYHALGGRSLQQNAVMVAAHPVE